MLFKLIILFFCFCTAWRGCACTEKHFISVVRHGEIGKTYLLLCMLIWIYLSSSTLYNIYCIFNKIWMYPYPSQWSFVAFIFLSHNLLPPSEKSHGYSMMSSSRCKAICVGNLNTGIFSESVKLMYFKTDNHCCTYSPWLQYYCRPHYIILWATFFSVVIIHVHEVKAADKLLKGEFRQLLSTEMFRTANI